MNLQLRAAYGQLDEKADELFFDPNVRVVVCTVYAAIGLLRNQRFGPMLDDGQAPFSTVVIDEAGLVSRAAAAALSLHAADRVWLVGDSRQLSPISRIERILAESKSRWLAKSGLSHLDRDQTTCAAVTMLSTQHRMHPEIGDVVSNFHYDGLLQHAADTDHHAWRQPAILSSHPRAIWYVLDEETRQRSKIRAARGPGQLQLDTTAGNRRVEKAVSRHRSCQLRWPLHHPLSRASCRHQRLSPSGWCRELVSVIGAHATGDRSRCGDL